MIENTLSILIGCPLDFQPGNCSKQVRSWYFKDKANNCPHQKGVFGYVTAYFGCIETQERGALHFHIIIWGGISPKLLEQAVYFPAVCDKIEHALDKMYCAELPKNLHLQHFLHSYMKETKEG